MNDKIYDGSMAMQSMELILGVHDNDKLYKSRLENLKLALEKIDNNFRKRLDEISNNAAKYQQSKVQDLEHNLRVSVRVEIEELVRAKGFESEIAEIMVELQKQEPRNDVQQLEQTMLEIETRKLMSDERKFQEFFMPEILAGNPLIVSAVENSPIPFPIDPGVFKDARERMREILKPLVYKKYQAMLQAQNTLEGLANIIMPLNSQRDEVAELAAGE